MKDRKINLFMYLLLFLIIVTIFPPIISILNKVYKYDGTPIKMSFDLLLKSYSIFSDLKMLGIALGVAFIFTLFMYMSVSTKNNIASVKTIKITNKIEIPIPAGNGQFGTSRFMRDEEKEAIFEVKSENFKFSKPGLILGKIGKKICSFVDIGHVLIIASTRSGKTRRIILGSIWRNAIAGVSGLVTDVKGEIYAYTHKFLESLGYKCIVFDLRDPALSMHHNYMNEIVNEVKNKNYSSAQDKTWDLVSILVGEPKGEPLWSNGEASAIAACILIVAMEAPENCKNLTNVFYFLAYMGEADEESGEVPLNNYISQLSDTHPAKAVYSIAKIAPTRTRGSFYTSALATLKEFTSWSLAEMTSKSDYDLKDLDDEKTMIYIILPDEKDTLYKIASLYIKQVYESLIDIANKKGGELDRKFINYFEEAGNIAKIPKFGSMLSAGGGRGILSYIVIQSYQQLEKNYEKDYQNILDNINTTVYLRSPSTKTHEAISKWCDKYTVQVNSSGTSSKVSDLMGGNDSNSSNSSLTGRPLLMPGEVGKFESPHALILKEGNFPAVMHTPDLTAYKANNDFGMGTPKQNRNLILRSNEERERDRRKAVEPTLWGIWNNYKNTEYKKNKPQEEKVSFL